jgi:hypothetical protein
MYSRLIIHVQVYKIMQHCVNPNTKESENERHPKHCPKYGCGREGLSLFRA